MRLLFLYSSFERWKIAVVESPVVESYCIDVSFTPLIIDFVRERMLPGPGPSPNAWRIFTWIEKYLLGVFTWIQKYPTVRLHEYRSTSLCIYMNTEVPELWATKYTEKHIWKKNSNILFRFASAFGDKNRMVVTLRCIFIFSWSWVYTARWKMRKRCQIDRDSIFKDFPSFSSLFSPFFIFDFFSNMFFTPMVYMPIISNGNI